MKKSLIIAAAMVAFASSMAPARTVRLPQVDAHASSNFLIRSVELTDTATRFNLSFLHYPGYWSSRDSMVVIGKNTGTSYPLVRSEGYPLGTKQPVDESGRFDFTFVFPPLHPADTLVDLYPVNLTANSATDVTRGIHLGADGPRGKYFANIHGRHPGKTGFVCITECDAREQPFAMVIPVDDGEFSATFFSDRPVFYQIIDGIEALKRSYSYGQFLPEGDDIEVEFILEDNGKEIDHVAIDAPVGSETRSLNELKQYTYDLWDNNPAVLHRLELQQSRSYYLPKYYELTDLQAAHPEKKDSIREEWSKFYAAGSIRTPEGDAVEDALRRFMEEDLDKAILERIGEMKNLAGLFELVNKLWFGKDASAYIDIYTRAYRGLFPDHPYSAAFEQLDDTAEPVPGNPFNDFVAPDFEGKEYRLSELVKGRPALIDLWASTCAPCRASSKSMIPVYNDFAPKGFTIVGVARESSTPALALKAIADDGYPWLNLLELDDNGHIWALYRRQNAMGGVFLIDAEGKIVAVDPTAEEVRAYLEKTLN